MARVSELEGHILEILEKQTEGQKITDLATALNMKSEDTAVRRSLQRALKSLEAQKKIEPKGQARARTYFISKKSTAKTQIHPKAVASVIKDIKLSKDGEKLLKHISQPIANRDPVGYNQNFLENYTPNKSFLLNLV